MIELRRVSKVYKTGTVALNKIDLSIEQGEFVFVTGPSGAGKTSIAKLLLCEEAPTYGDIYVNGKNIRRLARRQIPKYRRQIGVVFQDFRLIPSMTVFDNVAFAMRAVGRPYREIRKRVQAVLDIVELTDKRKSFPDQLSGGEQQRVALARAIVNAPKVIIADEPTGNLDGKLSFEMMKMLDYINSTGITVIVVTHEEGLVNYFGKRTVVLSEGRILKDIPADDTSKKKKAAQPQNKVQNSVDTDVGSSAKKKNDVQENNKVTNTVDSGDTSCKDSSADLHCADNENEVKKNGNSDKETLQNSVSKESKDVKEEAVKK